MHIIRDFPNLGNSLNALRDKISVSCLSRGQGSGAGKSSLALFQALRKSAGSALSGSFERGCPRLLP